jgi:O-antigen/teichoic acid export membrane protein
MPLVALGTFLAGFKAYHFDAAFQFAHRTIWQVWIVLFAAVVNLGLNYVAIPLWGISGAAGASVVAYVISIALTAWLGRRHFVLPFPVTGAVQVLLSAAAMAALLLPFRGATGMLAVGVQVAAGAAVYGTLLVAVNFLGLRDALFRGIGPKGSDVQAIERPASHLAEAQLP